MKFFLIALSILSCIVTQAQQLIFTRQINNNDNLMIMDENGGIKALTDHSRKDSSPMISPDGKMLVFTSERVGWWKIWTMNLNTKEFKQLTRSSSADYSPAWSPNGSKIVFTSSRDGNQEIYTMNKDGSNKVNITQSTSPDLMPSWGKDGFIYYSTRVNGIYQIARIRPDGTDKEMLTNSKDNKLMPQISNDGEKMLFYGDRNGNMEIYLLDVDRKEITRLTNNPLMDMRPRWSPDNTRIVFERGDKGNNHHIYIMNADGSNVKQLTFKNYNYTPSFYPNN
ncbi:DUF5050 domain-containing protein [Ekhidna sp. To15]|uniref:DUF5050 domain-containing protein n=1 Tax=Ekhidna sp. To15 TaxID=3395267 RepID=UPI003F525D9C